MNCYLPHQLMKFLALLIALLPATLVARDFNNNTIDTFTSTQIVAGDTVASTDSIVQSDTITSKRNVFKRLGDGVKGYVKNKMNEPYDTTRDNRYWWRAMKHGKINFKDSTMGYPKFVMFCYNVYTWGDKAFNSYDSAYVVPTGKLWKLTLTSRNWLDNLSGGNDKGYATFTSNMASNIGLSLSFMAVSLGYSLDIDRIFGSKGKSEMMEFSFTCARFTAEIHKTTNTSGMRNRLKYNGGSWQRSENMNALRRESMGLSATYFFNNKKYARAAAYCYSKYQKRSAGSALAGFSIVNYDFKVDTEALTPEQLIEYHDIGATHMRFTDYCLTGGYAHNWVLNPKLLLNATGFAGAGVKHVHSTMGSPSSNSGALKMGGKLALVYNHKMFFASVLTNVNTSMYIASSRHFSYTIADFTAVFGIRF